MADWVAYRYRLPAATARQWVKAAHALRGMPLLEARYAAGEVSFEQVPEPGPVGGATGRSVVRRSRSRGRPCRRP